MASHELFMADVLSQFPHGPPAVGSIKIATKFWTELYQPSVPVDINHESSKIHVLWRFIWNCFKRSSRSKHFALDRLKGILSLQRAGRANLRPEGVHDEDESDDENWPEDEDARIATPAPEEPEAPPIVSRYLREVLSIPSSAKEEPEAPPAGSAAVLEPPCICRFRRGSGATLHLQVPPRFRSHLHLHLHLNDVGQVREEDSGKEEAGDRVQQGVDKGEKEVCTGRQGLWACAKGYEAEACHDRHSGQG